MLVLLEKINKINKSIAKLIKEKRKKEKKKYTIRRHIGEITIGTEETK